MKKEKLPAAEPHPERELADTLRDEYAIFVKDYGIQYPNFRDTLDELRQRNDSKELEALTNFLTSKGLDGRTLIADVAANFGTYGVFERGPITTATTYQVLGEAARQLAEKQP